MIGVNADQSMASWNEEALFRKAAKITVAEYGDGPLYIEGASGDWTDGFFSGHAAVLDHYAGKELPEYAWACSPVSLHLDAESIIADGIEQHDMHDGAGDSVSDDAEKELQVLLDGWCARHPVTSWLQDTKRAVILGMSDGAS